MAAKEKKLLLFLTTTRSLPPFALKGPGNLPTWRAPLWSDGLVLIGS